MPADAPLAEAHDLAELHRAFRDRAQQLNITRATIDAIGGLPSGHAGAVLAPNAKKTCVGKHTLGGILGALALKILVVEDPEALARIKSRLEPADRDRQRFFNRNHKTARAKQMSESPKYKLVAPDDRDFVTFNNMPERTGRVVEFMGWPDIVHMEPVNEPARRIHKFAKAHQCDSARPPTPRDEIGCAIYLPVLDGGYREGKNATPGMPRYIPQTHNFELRKRFIPVGVEFTWVAWPTFGIEPANEPAERVAAYLEANRDHPRLPVSPWNDFDDTPWLPELPEIKKGPGALRDLESPTYRSHDEFRRGNLLPAAAPAPHPRGTRRRVA